MAASRFLWTDKLARPEQLPTDGEWSVYLYLAGRGAGKTRTAAEWIAWKAIETPNTRWAVVAATFSDVRDTCAEGESGLVPILRRYNALESYNRSMGEIRLTNGSRIKLYSADTPDRFRGPQHHGAWCDELAAWQYPDAWDQLQFGLRLGLHPQTIVTTTPRPVSIIRKMLDRTDGSVKVVRGSTFDNAANLAPSAIRELKERYEGTRLGRQELYGELLEEQEGALWTWGMIEESRVKTAPELTRILVAVDPAGGSGSQNDETGIVVVGVGTDKRGYVLADRSCRMSPDGWAREVVNAYDEFGAVRVVAEKNFGGEMVEAVIRQQRSTIPLKLITAKRGKYIRAEPISALYEQSKISHVGVFEALEDQMINWVQGESDFSPDRIDALVHGLTELNLGAGNSADRYFAAIAPECPKCFTPNAATAAVCISCGTVISKSDARVNAGFPTL
jgi:phage terminase large subunit-like protein